MIFRLALHLPTENTDDVTGQSFYDWAAGGTALRNLATVPLVELAAGMRCDHQLFRLIMDPGRLVKKCFTSIC